MIVRLACTVLAALLVPASVALSQQEKGAPFSGAWEHRDTYQGESIWAWEAMIQKGQRVCAISQDFATNAYYTHRLTGTADGNRVHFDRICGDRGMETDAYCTARAPNGADPYGWRSYNQTLHLCRDRLTPSSSGCNSVAEDAGMTRTSADRLPLSEEDRAWLSACAARE
ncbi:hypothetical protein JQK15_20025 [Sphingobium sp. BHU LFT2]|uniref:hypothetical protein n=1 Tax=Sphingobium sp. BHU LFT2 TaxID=2807634 RepID=UPI001BE537C9|nr:hypothetical protein [Sphingobium sp. BHU LFT2]MBT2245805.1 hypothetical protein [Sphingobium sp. BHU LFT2]